MFKKTAFFAAALVGPAALISLGATATPASAAENTPTAMVYYTDLDLSTDEGQEMLEQRLVKAARKVCRMDQPAVGSNLPSSSSISCYRKATKKMDDQIAAAVRDQDKAMRFGG